MTSPLLNCPAEVIHNICQKIVNDPECLQPGYMPQGCPFNPPPPWWYAIPGYPALINLRLTCSALAAIGEPFTHQRLHIQFDEPSHNEAALKHLTANPQFACRIKTLVISTCYQPGHKYDAPYLFGEATRLRCNLPLALSGILESPSVLGQMLQAITIDLALMHAPEVEELVLARENENHELGWYFPPALDGGAFRLGSLKHVRVSVGFNWDTETSLLVPLVRHAPGIETLLVQRYRMKQHPHEEKLWEFLGNLTAVDFEQTLAVTPEELLEIGQHCPKLESFRFVWDCAAHRSTIEMRPRDILAGLFPLRNTTLKHLDLDLVRLTVAPELREEFARLPAFTALERLQINFREVRDASRFFCDPEFLVECLPRNIKKLSLLKIAYELDDAMEELAKSVKQGGFSALQEIWYPEHVNDDEGAEALEKLFEGTKVLVRQNGWEGQRWYLDYIPRDIDKDDDDDDDDDDEEEEDGEEEEEDENDESDGQEVGDGDEEQYT